MKRLRCLACGVEFLEPDEGFTPTVSPGIVRVAHCGGIARLATLVDVVDVLEAAKPINLHEEAKRIFEVEEDSASGPPDVSVADAPTSDDTPDDRVQIAYVEWMKTPDGRAVAREIRDRAFALQRRGWRRFGIQAIAEAVRYDRALEAGPDAAGYRVNNSHLSRLARDLMTHYPELEDFFETRELRA